MSISHHSYWIKKLNLQPHPEGGWFSETYRSQETIDAAALPARFGASRCFGTSIYFLLTSDEFSSLHRIKSDEVWHFYSGSALTVVTIDDQGNREDLHLGSDPEHDQHFQAVVPAGRWFGSFVQQPAAFALVGCTVSPGFDFADFELARRDELLRSFPQHEEIIRRLTRE